MMHRNERVLSVAELAIEAHLREFVQAHLDLDDAELTHGPGECSWWRTSP